MNPPCAACQKPVYPVEKLSILDKFWHKGCFRCTTCRTTLNIKNFKGYGKLPYCQAHGPKVEHTVIADTPENIRLAKQTQSQSSIAYQKEFIDTRGKYTAVSDDPETLRVMKNTNIQSNNKYRNDPRQIGFTTVSDNPELLRVIKQSDILSDVKYRIDPSQQQFTVVHDTPEIERLKKQSDLQSHVKYSKQNVAKNTPQSDNNTMVHVQNDGNQPQNPVQDEVLKQNYVALYDAEKIDDDEVSIQEGDLIVDAFLVSEGWLMGRNARTNECGLLPSNYVQLAQ